MSATSSAPATPRPPTPPGSPVILTGRLDPDLSRGLWLVKWLLVIPHLVVLFFLWVAAGVLTVVAGIAILVTGRYPLSIFDFNLGVMRWSWRVFFYAYGALGTDRYPPFTLADVPDYPARLDIAYPERLSRGLVLVKWWLLAIPHYLVLAFFLGAGDGRRDGGDGWPWTVGLVGLLTAFAGFALLFTARYPRTIFDLVLGMDRWAARVGAYALLMTDVYPPFRLDQGGDDTARPRLPGPGHDPAGAAAATPTPTPTPEDAGIAGTVGTAAPYAAPTNAGSGYAHSGYAGPGPAGPTPYAAPGPRRWTPLRIVSLAAGALLLAAGLGTGLGGGALLFADRELRGNDGFLTTSSAALATPSHAIVSQDMHLGSGSAVHTLVGDLRLTVSGSDRPLLVGIASTSAVERYLDGVGHAVLTDVRDGTPVLSEVAGGAPTAAPTTLGIWDASTVGSGTRTLTWDASDGHWTMVLMNADGSAPVAAEVSVGATLPFLGWGATTLLVTGAVLALVGLVLVLVALPRGHQRPPTAGSHQPAPPGLTAAVP